MLIELSVKNCFVFNNQIVFSLDPTNKEMAIYGPNNAGKTCLIKCITVLDVRCDIFFENALIDFRVIIGIILLKVAIPLDVVSIHKSCGRMRDGKHSCLIIVDNRQKTLPDLIF